MSTKYMKWICNFLFVISIPFLTIILCGNYDLSYIKFLLFISFLSGIFISKMILNDNFFSKINKKYLVIAILFGLYGITFLARYSDSGVIFFRNLLNNFFAISLNVDSIKIIVSFASLPSIILLSYYFINKVIHFIVKEYHDLTKIEKVFMLLVVIIGFCFITLLYNKTDAFYYPHYNHDKLIIYDVIYTSDSGALIQNNAFMNIGMSENDIRQPLFGLFAFPFALIANFASNFLGLIPNSYYILFGTLQMFLIALSFVFIEKMLNLSDKNKILFLIIALFSYSFLLFSIVIEQYAIAFFYLILTIYCGYKNKYKINYTYIGAVSTLLTSGIVFPFISKFKNLKNWFLNVSKCFMVFILMMITTGQILLVFDLKNKINSLMVFSGVELTFVDKFQQFLYFVRSCFIAPSGQIVSIDGSLCYYLIDINFFSIIGSLILFICVISFIINRKNRMALIAFLWVIFSFLILCLFGWGTQENGLILYSLYFGWAYIILVYLFIDKIVKNLKLKYFVIIILCFIMLIINFNEFYNMIKFCIEYYPK